MRFERKNIRLPADQYRGKRAYFLTLCCEHRQPVFGKGDRAGWLIRALRAHCVLHRFALHAYCVMPDHVHLMAEGMDADCDLLRFVKFFKQQTGFRYKQETGEHLWQKKFYDHILRPQDSMEAVVWYIWMNPVRKKLADLPQEYPFSGSATLPWPVQVQPIPRWSPPWKANDTSQV